MPDRAQLIAEALGARPQGDGWMCCCPGHSDPTPSLSINAGDDSRALLHCFGGCDIDGVLDALGLDLSHLFGDGPELPTDFYNRAASVAAKAAAASTRSSSKGRSGRRVPPPSADQIARFYECTVRNRAHGGDPDALDYLRGRGIELDRLSDQSFGLLGDTASDHPAFAKFKRDAHRVIVPVYDVGSGALVNVQARSIEDGGHRKIDSPAGVQLARTAFMNDRALAAVCGAKLDEDQRRVLVVGEGLIDHLTLLSLGLPFATIAAPGASQANRCLGVWARGWTLIAALDNDEAGRKATAKLSEHARAVGVERFHDFGATMPEETDLNDRLQRVGGDELRTEIEAMLTDEGELLGASDGVDVEPDQAGAEVEALEWNEFPTHALPDHIARFVGQAAASIPVDEALVALPVLSVLAGSIGNARRFEARPGYEQPSVLWGLVLLSQGCAKSVAFDLARGPLKRLRSEEGREYRGEVEAWERLSRAQKAGSPAPAERFRLVDDATLEGIAKRLSNQSRGLILGSDEFASVLNMAEYKQNSNDSSRLCKLWDASDLNVTRSSAPGIFVERAAISLVGAAQPELFERAASADLWDGGLLARFMIAMPPSTRRRWAGGVPLDPEVADEYDSIVRRLYHLPTRTRGSVLSFAPSAAKLFGEFYDETNSQAERSSDPVLGALATKAISNALRIAGVFQVAQWANDDGAPEPGQVSRENVGRAIEVGRWLLREGRRVWGLVGVKGSRSEKYRRKGRGRSVCDCVPDEGLKVRDVCRALTRNKDEVLREVAGDSRLRIEERVGGHGRPVEWVVRADV
ncbi:MAG: DUF3987 domain-containing protein [Planctomycetota bacterium]